MATAQRTPQAYPQIDRVLWCSLPEAYERILPEQPPLLDKLQNLREGSGRAGKAVFIASAVGGAWALPRRETRSPGAGSGTP